MISIAEYLKTTTEPDCEYVDGAIELRTPAEFDHASWHIALLGWFFQREIEWGLRVLHPCEHWLQRLEFVFPMSSCSAAMPPANRS